MQSIPVDINRLGTLMCVVAPEPKLVNRDTGELKVDRDGVTVWTVGVSVRQRDTRRTSVIEIAVSGEPSGIAEGVRVIAHDLVAFAWEQGGRHGTSFRAASITPAGTPGPAAERPAGPLSSALRAGKDKEADS
ncbi:hypothetical protein GT354_08655 [Streptomyces sp. SID3343]|nr:hypothetical protein [Streptomyces sp. SID3343]MYV98347.1 hypothetical protein [Streptomyces sp. SID3343]